MTSSENCGQLHSSSLTTILLSKQNKPRFKSMQDKYNHVSRVNKFAVSSLLYVTEVLKRQETCQKVWATNLALLTVYNT